MGGMHLPPSVHVMLAPSRWAGLGIGALALCTIAVVLALPVIAWVKSATIVAIAAWAVVAVRTGALHRGRFAVAELRLAPDLMLVVCMSDGRLVAGHVRESTYVGEWLTTIVWRADGAYVSRTILILPDMLPARDFRRLRVMLRYARRRASAVIPASHA